MQKVTELSIPSLEKLVLIEMPQLERCSCNSVRDFNSALRILKIQRCRVLKAFPLFESCKEHKIEKKSWLSHLSELTIHNCPRLTISNPLPPSSSGCKLSIARVSTLPTMEGSSNGELIIGADSYDGEFDKDSDGLTNLDDKIVSFHNLRDLTRLQIAGYQNLSSISLEGFRQLISLRSLEIVYCRKLFSSVVLAEHTHEYMADANFIALPSLKHLRIDSCGITGKWLTVILKHVPALEELHLEDHNISGLLIEGKESGLSHLTSAPRASSPGNRDDAMSSSTPDGLLRVPSKLIPSLKKMSIRYCRNLTFHPSKEGFSGFTSLEELILIDRPDLMRSSVHKDENNDHGTGRWLLPHSLGKLVIDSCTEILQPYFEENHTCLKKLRVQASPNLRCLQLDSCTALEELYIGGCNSLTALEGLDSCTALEELGIDGCNSLTALKGLDSCTALERLYIHYSNSLTALEGLQSRLKKLRIWRSSSLKCLQLDSCIALEELKISGCNSLTALEGLQSRLKKLQIYGSPSLRCLQLDSCTALEELNIGGCNSLTALEGLNSCTALEEIKIKDCESLTALEGLQSLGDLRFLVVSGCRVFTAPN